MSTGGDASVKLLVLGIGSPFGDDRVGWEVVERLKGEGVAARFPEVRFDTADRPGSLLLTTLEGVDAAILIDAVEAGLAPGEIVRLADEAIDARAETLFSSHGLGVGQALQLGRSLGRLPPRLILFGVQLSVSPLPETAEAPLSKSVTAAIDSLVSQIEESLQELLSPSRYE